jgi:hypothetical protein
MYIFVMLLTSASLFSVDGLGHDMSAFQTPFLNVGKYARIEFNVQPEWTILRQGGSMRGIFWSNPFQFCLTTPVYQGFAIAVGNRERLNQNFDVYHLSGEDLRIHVVSQGGVEEAYGTIGYKTKLGEVVFQGSYLFGNTRETWDYLIQNYNLIDTFDYQYSGSVFSIGIGMEYVSCYYETFGKLDMTKPSTDTAFDLSDRLGVGVHVPLLGVRLSGEYEYSWWPEQYGFSKVHRFKVILDKDQYGFGYRFHPWYLERVREHGIEFSYTLPLPYLGLMRLNLDCALRETEEVQELMIAPKVELSIQELFARRRK